MSSNGLWKFMASLWLMGALAQWYAGNVLIGFMYAAVCILCAIPNKSNKMDATTIAAASVTVVVAILNFFSAF